MAASSEGHRGNQARRSFLWGRDILVAPVTEKGAKTRDVYLPSGVWYDFWNHEKVVGGRVVSRNVDLATMPLYVRAGAIIPFGPVKQYTEEKVNAPSTLRVYPGADGQFELYEDDGRTFNFRRGEWMGIVMRWTDKSHRLSLSLAKDSRFFGVRSFEVVVDGDSKTRSISFSGRPVSIQL